MQHSLYLYKYLYVLDVGAVIDRPRAIDNRPYSSMIVFWYLDYLA